jgi:hypothetical protein
MTLSEEERVAYADLIERPQFKLFLLQLIQLAGIYEATANGSAERTFFMNGRRSLGLDALRMVEAANPLAAPNSSTPTLTLIQVLLADAQSPPQQRTSNGRRNDPYSDIRPDADEPGSD